ncbi:MAG: DUF5123 domain-containing protein, partial [Planctomycetota bacterium]|nr:DUF5123 domain-containing protein [Planctomycetota bacterium]
ASAQRTGAQPAERHPSPIPGCVAAGPAILLDGAGINNAVWGNEIEGGAKGVEVRGRGSEGLHLYSNRIRGIAGPGILLAGAGPRGEIRVYGNRIRLSRAGVEFDCPLRERILVFRNVLYENGRDFVVRGRTAALLLAYHNTCASPTGVEYAGDGQAAAEGVRFFNNIFGGEKFVETSGGADAKPGFFTDYNVIRDNAREIREKYGWEANGLLGADPKFEDPAKGNFWLRPDSPAVGRGINISLIEQGIPDTYEPLHPEARPDAGALPNRIARRDEEAFEFRLQEQPGR